LDLRVSEIKLLEPLQDLFFDFDDLAKAYLYFESNHEPAHCAIRIYFGIKYNDDENSIPFNVLHGYKENESVVIDYLKTLWISQISRTCQGIADNLDYEIIKKDCKQYAKSDFYEIKISEHNNGLYFTCNNVKPIEENLKWYLNRLKLGGRK
jgi:hypothetical protein